MSKGALFVAISCLLVLAWSSAHANPDTGALDQLAIACDGRINDLSAQIASVNTWANVFMILGAVVAATGSALAGFLREDRSRKLGAVAGALGAVISVLPKALPDKSALQELLTSAGKHRLVGLKVQAQLPYLQNADFIRENEKYATARFTECRSLNPDPKIPELPAPMPAMSSATASTTSDTTVATTPHVVDTPPAMAEALRSANDRPIAMRKRIPHETPVSPVNVEPSARPDKERVYLRPIPEHSTGAFTRPLGATPPVMNSP